MGPARTVYSDGLAVAPSSATSRPAQSALRARISAELERIGARGVCYDWAELVETLTDELSTPLERSRSADGCPPFTSEAARLRYTVRRDFWRVVLSLVDAGDPRAFAVLWKTLLRLMARWDRKRSIEAEWEDIAQQVAIEVAARYRERRVRHAWALLSRIARCRFIDAQRRQRVLHEAEAHEAATSSVEPLFVKQALSMLAPRERHCIELMDLQGLSRSEASSQLQRSPGEVLAIRRRGLRELWRWLGDGLPRRPRQVWNELFKGGERSSPELASKRLGMSPAQARSEFARARALLGL